MAAPLSARAAATLAWLADLRDGPVPTTALSAEGLRLALDDALDALAELPAALDRLGPAVARAAVIAPRTVVTAPLEWCAMLLGAGAEVVLKPPHDAPGLCPWFAAAAAARGLPLRLDPRRAAIADAELVIAMGSDETMAALRRTVDPTTRLLAFGHRIGVAWWPADADADALARDLAAHDGRGCMTPAVILTDRPDVDRLAAAMARAEAAWPRGACTPGELAAVRARTALARVVGQVRLAPAWAVHVVPPEHASAHALPRVAQLVAVTDEPAARAWVADHPEVGTVGRPPGGDWGVARTCDLGQMQRPPLLRDHDGVDVWAAMRR